MSKAPALCPDCGQYPATLHDGSGWFCAPCKAFVDQITALIEIKIRCRNLDESPAKVNQRRHWRNWYHRKKAAAP